VIYYLAASVISNEQIVSNYWRLVLKAPPLSKKFQPGQFVALQCTPKREPLLKRPLGIYSADPGKGTITLIYKVVGEGTKCLTTIVPGNSLTLLGPLGNGFNLKEDEKKIILVAGGLGMVSLFPVLKKIRQTRKKVEIFIYWGADSQNHFFLEKDLIGLGLKNIRLATDDGSRGYHGLITELFARDLRHFSGGMIFACGPTPMLSKVAQLSKKYRLAAQVSLEARMACGWGVCQGCVVATVNGYKKVCDEGPVFEAGEIIWP
jgi:dihydroorotate dehydrogenase electron transfer subunit